MPLQATLPLSVVNVPNDYFSMAGFEVTLHGRFWVTPEDSSFSTIWIAAIQPESIRFGYVISETAQCFLGCESLV